LSKFSHFNALGEAQMVDVGEKPSTKRRAVAEGFITMQTPTLQLIIAGEHKKGDVLGIARIAGIIAAKRTSELIPLCHPILLTHIHVDLTPLPEQNQLYCQAIVETVSQTGVEMEALTAVQIALLTVYDMCKAVDRGMCIEKVQLTKKSGGQSGVWERD
jgi:cyclic pyranopterin phosphate synthase